MLSSHCKASYHRSCWPGIHSLHHVLMLSDLYHQHEEATAKAQLCQALRRHRRT